MSRIALLGSLLSLFFVLANPFFDHLSLKPTFTLDDGNLWMTMTWASHFSSQSHRLLVDLFDLAFDPPISMLAAFSFPSFYVYLFPSDLCPKFFHITVEIILMELFHSNKVRLDFFYILYSLLIQFKLSSFINIYISYESIFYNNNNSRNSV